MNIYSIYKITNKINNKAYIGFTSNPVNSRWSMHKYQAKSKRSNAKIHSAIRDHGVDNFVLETLYQSLDIYHTLSMEQPFIDQYDSLDNGYNSQSGGQLPQITGYKKMKKVHNKREIKALEKLIEVKKEEIKSEQQQLIRNLEKDITEVEFKISTYLWQNAMSCWK